MSAKHILYTRRTGQWTSYGCEQLELLSYLPNGGIQGPIPVVSGAPGRQNFRTRAEEVRGHAEPCPEGEYRLGPLEWAGGPDNYSTIYSPALGPIWVDMNHSAIGLHLDANVTYSPGSAGCVVFRGLTDLRRFVSWMRMKYTPTRIIVDHGFGTVMNPHADPAEDPDGRIVVRVNGETIGTGQLIDGVTYGPVRALADALGASVFWDPENRVVDVRECLAVKIGSPDRGGE